MARRVRDRDDRVARQVAFWTIDSQIIGDPFDYILYNPLFNSNLWWLDVRIHILQENYHGHQW